MSRYIRFLLVVACCIVMQPAAYAFAKGDAVFTASAGVVCPTTVRWSLTVSPSYGVSVVLDKNTLTRAWVPAPNGGTFTGTFENQAPYVPHRVEFTGYVGSTAVSHITIDEGVVNQHCGL